MYFREKIRKRVIFSSLKTNINLHHKINVIPQRGKSVLAWEDQLVKIMCGIECVYTARIVRGMQVY